MNVRISRIAGTTHDYALNRFIGFVNSKNDPVFAAHAVAAIGRVLMVNHEVDAGAPWLQKTMPLVEHVVVSEPSIDKLYDLLVQQAKELHKPGCGVVTLILIAAAIIVASRFLDG